MRSPSETVRRWIARLLDRLPGRCWADLCSWASGDGGRFSWAPQAPECREDAARCGACYCGKLRAPAPAREASNG